MKKKLLSLLMLLTCVCSGAWGNYSSTQSGGNTTLTWDFGEFGSTAASYESPYSYEGLSLVMTYVENKDYIKSGAFHANGASSTSNRYISYTPSYDGTLTVTFSSNNSGDAANRTTAIGTTITAGATSATSGVLAIAPASTGTVSANLTAGTTYYVWLAAGGQTIKKLQYVYAESRQQASLSFATTSGSQDINDGTSFTLPTLTKTPADATVTYASSMPAVATVNTSTGAVTLIKKGTTVITASFAGDADYTPAEATFTLTVEDRNAFDPANYNVVKTYDFAAMGNVTLTKGSSSIGKIWNAANNNNANVYRLTNDGLESIAVQDVLSSNKGWSIKKDQGLYEGGGAGRCAAICDIKAGWIVEFYHNSTNLFYTRNNQDDDTDKDNGLKKISLVEESNHHVFQAQTDGMIGFELVRDHYVSKIVIYTSEAPKTVSFAKGDALGEAPASLSVYEGTTVKLPINQSLYKEGYTLTGWNDGTTTYAPGQTIAAPTTNTEFSPVFTANVQSIYDNPVANTITWNFSSKVAIINCQYKVGYYVQQVTVNGETIDVPMIMDTTNGKMNNSNRTDDWIQSNGGTKLTIPAAKGMTIVINSYYEFGRPEDNKGNALTKTKIAGSEDYTLSSGNKTATYTYNGTAKTIDIEVGGDVGYLSTIVASYPVTTIPGPTDPVSSEITEIATITSNGTASSTVTPTGTTAIITTSGNTNSNDLGSYAFGLKLESSSGIITIALPDNAKNASVELLSSATASKLKLNDVSTDVTFTGDATNGYTTTIDIDDSNAGSSFTIKKDSGSPVIYRIKLVYNLGTVSLTLTTTDNMAGWRAFYDASNGYTVDGNTTVYIATAKDASTVTLSSISDIPAGTPVILKTSSSADSHKMTLTKATTTSSDATGNLLSASTAGQNLNSGNIYRLGYGVDGVGFYPWSTASATAGIVYINTTAGARSIKLVFDDETSIQTMSAGQKQPELIYDLQGRRVAQPTKGLYIVNGKKVVIK